MVKNETTFDKTSDSITGDIHEYTAFLERQMEQLNKDYAIEKRRSEQTLEGINQDTMKAGRESSYHRMETADVYLRQAADKVEKMRDHYRILANLSQGGIDMAREHSILTARVRDAK
tara:strand:- start:829 stop:1179 length:351 start_codon:yes stop_codon:yes gene_type:complete